jgi:hypothetical protein
MPVSRSGIRYAEVGGENIAGSRKHGIEVSRHDVVGASVILSARNPMECWKFVAEAKDSL